MGRWSQRWPFWTRLLVFRPVSYFLVIHQRFRRPRPALKYPATACPGVALAAECSRHWQRVRQEHPCATRQARAEHSATSLLTPSLFEPGTPFLWPVRRTGHHRRPAAVTVCHLLDSCVVGACDPARLDVWLCGSARCKTNGENP